MAAVKPKLVSSGVSWASNIPDVPVVFNIAGNADVQMIAGYYDLLDTLGTWLPILAVVLLLLSILIAPSRLGGLAKAAGWLAFSMVVLTVVADRRAAVADLPGAATAAGHPGVHPAAHGRICRARSERSCSLSAVVSLWPGFSAGRAARSGCGRSSAD